MASGVPVITSNTSSLPEVVGEAAILIDATNIKEISKAIHDIYSNIDIKNELIKKGIIQSLKFSWRKLGNDLFTLYKQLLPFYPVM